jgi:hypothetical protein
MSIRTFVTLYHLIEEDYWLLESWNNTFSNMIESNLAAERFRIGGRGKPEQYKYITNRSTWILAN